MLQVVHAHLLAISIFILQIKDKNTGYFPLFQARSLREKKDEALTELGELKKMMSVIVEHHQEMVDVLCME